MSTSDVNEPCSNWGRLTSVVIKKVTKRLDSASLFNCMLVNWHWREAVERRCTKSKKWDLLLEEATNYRTSVIKNRTKEDDKGIIRAALSWHFIKHATLRLHHMYQMKVRSISMFEDNLIIASDKVLYYNIDLFVRLDKKGEDTDNFVETSSMIVFFDKNFLTSDTLTIRNKLHVDRCSCEDQLQHIFYGVVYWRLDNKSCYVWDKKNVLLQYTAEKCNWMIDTIANYDSSYNFVCGMNVHREKIYLFTKIDPAAKKKIRGFSKQIYKLPVDLPKSTTPRMFNTFSVLCAEAHEDQQHIHVTSAEDQIIVACPGLSSATEHGRMLLLGYNDGKVQIFRRADLSRRITKPQVEFHLREYAKGMKSSMYKVIAIDVYEGKNWHHLFVATECTVYEFHLIHYNAPSIKTTDTVGITTFKLPDPADSKK